jgi:hypothetical protein
MTERMITTKLPQRLIDHLEREWPDRHTVQAARSVSGAAVNKSDVVEYTRMWAIQKLQKESSDRGFVVLSEIAITWTINPRGDYQATLEPEYMELPWSPAEPCSDTDMLICRASAIAIRPLPSPAPVAL